jgi:SEC-C motif domain protein
MNNCPCKSNKYFQNCCAPLIEGQQKATTPEQLMRSRYTAYTLHNIDYIQKTMSGPALKNFNYSEAQQWSQNVTWVGLEVLNSNTDKNNPNISYVEYKAFFETDKNINTLHEKSKFIRENQEWFYIDGQVLS